MKCEYGCDKDANFQLKNGKWCCKTRPSGCDVIKKINSDAVTNMQAEGRGRYDYSSLSDETKEKMNWNKGNYSNTKFEYDGSGSHKIVLLIERGHICEECKLSEWNNLPIPLELEHTDGDNKNNTKDNLKLLCCNCHALTPTWRGRNKNTGQKKVSDNDLIIALKETDNIRQALQKVGLVAKGGNYARAKKLFSKLLDKDANV